MELIDTHVHLLHPDRFSYAWCAGRPVLDRPWRIGDYQAAASAGAAQVGSFVFMEGDVPAAQQAEEVACFSQLADAPRGTPALAAIIAAAWPESDDFPGQLARLAGHPRVRGLRRVLHTMPEALCLAPKFAANVRRLPAHGLTFDLCLRPHLLAAASELAARCPETQFVLDHCSVPDVAGGGLDPWRDSLRGLAARPNVVCKFSGLASLCDPRRPLTAQVRPYFEHCVDCFTPDRLMWGSDWPLCDLTFNLGAWIETTVELLDGLRPPERRLIASDTARRIYRL